MTSNIFEEWDHVYDDKITTSLIADSYLDCDAVRVSTFLLHMPRIMLPEITRHRVFSFSIQSSRARSNKTKAHSVHVDPFTPELAVADHTGMSNDTLLPGALKREGQKYWHLAREYMLDFAKKMNSIGWSHQYTNRLLEPFMMVDVLMTGTSWDNFIKLRTDKDAQFEIQVTARQIQSQLDENIPQELRMFHLPFIKREDELFLSDYEQSMVSVARCARTSYIDPTDSTHSFKRNIQLANNLLADFHMSPFESQIINAISNVDLSGNLCGGIQLRKLIEQCNFDLIEVERRIDYGDYRF